MTSPPVKCFRTLSQVMQFYDETFEDELRKAATALAVADIDPDDAARWLSHLRREWQASRVIIHRKLVRWLRDPEASTLTIDARDCVR